MSAITSVLANVGTFCLGVSVTLIVLGQDNTMPYWFFTGLAIFFIIAALVIGYIEENSRKKEQRQMTAKLDEVLRRTHHRKHWTPEDWKSEVKKEG